MPVRAFSANRWHPEQCRIQVVTQKSPNMALRTGQLVPSQFPLPDPKQERAWIHLEVLGCFSGSEPFDGFGMFRR